jgi:hypothetical protein
LRDESAYLGSTDTFIDRVLRAATALQQGQEEVK